MRIHRPINTGWEFDREVAVTAVESSLAPVVKDAPTATKVHLCYGFSRVQIIHFSEGTITGGDSNTYTVYVIDRVGNHNPMEPSKTGVTYIQKLILSMVTTSGTLKGTAGLVPSEIDTFSDIMLGNIGSCQAYGNFVGVSDNAAEAGPNMGYYLSSINDIGLICLGLPACWGIAFQWTTKDVDTDGSNLLLKFS